MPMSEYEASQLANEARKLAQENDHKSRELALREAELADHRKSRFTPFATTLIAAATAILGAASGALLQGRANLALEQSKYEFSKEIERQKLESSLILQAVSTGKQDDSVKNLRFLVRVNLISEKTLRRNVTELLDKAPEQTAVLPAASAGDLIGQAMDRARKGSLTDAIDLYKRVLHQNPRDPEALNYLGYALFRQGQPGEAIEKLQQAVAIDPHYTWAYYNLSLAYFKSNRDADGLAAVRKLLSLNPGFKNQIKGDGQFRPFLDAQPALRALVGGS
jgi:tetratricopeptide (TPR) repeat protein